MQIVTHCIHTIVLEIVCNSLKFLWYSMKTWLPFLASQKALSVSSPGLETDLSAVNANELLHCSQYPKGTSL